MYRNIISNILCVYNMYVYNLYVKKDCFAEIFKNWDRDIKIDTDIKIILLNY